MRRLLTAVLLLMFTHIIVKAQNQQLVDSLYADIQHTESDSDKVKKLTELVRLYWYSNPDSSILFAEEARQLAEQLENKKFLAITLSSYGVPYEIKGEYQKAAVLYTEALVLFKELKMERGEAGALSNLGLTYYYEANFPKALEYFIKSLGIYESVSDSAGIGRSCNNTGMVYEQQKDYAAALRYYFRSIEIKTKMGNKNGAAATYNNIGLIYHLQNSIPEALEAFLKAKKINEEVGNKTRLSVNLDNIARLHWRVGDYKKSLENFEQALAIREELGYNEGIVTTLTGIAHLKVEFGHADDSDLKNMIDRAYNLGQEIGVMVHVKEVCEVRSLYNEEIGNYKLAYEAYREAANLKDSIFNEDKSKEIGKLEARYEFERAEEDKKREAEEMEARLRTEKSRSDNLQYSGILIFLVLLAGVVLTLGKLSISVRLAEGIVFFAFLLFFEFLLVLLDPYIENFSGGEPAYKLLFNAVLAGMIFPLHAFFESRIKARIS